MKHVSRKKNDFFKQKSSYMNQKGKTYWGQKSTTNYPWVKCGSSAGVGLACGTYRYTEVPQFAQDPVKEEQEQNPISRVLMKKKDRLFCLKAASTLLEGSFHIGTSSRDKLVTTAEGVPWWNLNPKNGSEWSLIKLPTWLSVWRKTVGGN